MLQSTSVLLLSQKSTFFPQKTVVKEYGSGWIAAELLNPAKFNNLDDSPIKSVIKGGVGNFPIKSRIEKAAWEKNSNFPGTQRHEGK